MSLSLADIGLPVPSLRAQPVGAVGRGCSWPVGASVVLHALLIALLIALPANRTPRRLRQPVLIDIDLVAPPSARALASATPDRSRPAEPPPAAVAPRTRENPMITATRMFAADALNDPVNRDTKAALAGLIDDEQTIQLCALEAMEQVAAADPSMRPQQLVTDAMREANVTVDRVVADGAAFYSANAWHAIAFDCAVSADRARVLAFRFRVGEPIPRHQWEANNLPVPWGAAIPN